MILRIRFGKQGCAQFLSHLDIMRYFQKLLRRADVDVKYSGGFSPHQIMSFGNPLGLAQINTAEYVDVELNSLNYLPDPMLKQDNGRILSSETFCERLNRFSPPDGSLPIISCRILPEKADNVMAAVAAASYVIRDRENISKELSEKRISLFDHLEEARKVLDATELIVLKKTKKSETETDIRPMILSAEWNAENRSLTLLTKAGSVSNLKPELVISGIHEKLGIEYYPMQYLIAREDLFTGETKEEDGSFSGKLISLGEIGTLPEDYQE